MAEKVLVIGVDYRDAARPHLAGKGQYVWHLMRALWQTAPVNFLLYVNKSGVMPGGLPSQVKVVRLPDNLFLYHISLWMRIQFSNEVDLFFAPTSYIVPAGLFFKKYIVAVMDLVAWKFPEGHNKRALFFERMLGSLALKKATRIVAISESTKRDVAEVFNIPAQRITVTPLAAALIAESPYLRPASLAFPFFLFIGTLEPRKNLVRLIEAYNEISSDPAIPHLVLAGKAGWQSDQILQAAASNEKVHILGAVSEADKSTLLKFATCLVFPSLYEGFGLPPLEAMAVGLPVIASNTSSLPEVVGDAGLLVDPLDTKGLAAALAKVAGSKELRDQLSARGQERAAQFNWHNTAKLTYEVFKDCVEN
jgi:glycosyltransferase involved in cell wall biosynthesis